MRNTTSFKVLAVTAAMLLCSCSATDAKISQKTTVTVAGNDVPTSAVGTSDKPKEENMIYAHIGENVLPIELCDNSSADAFRELVSNGLTIDMVDYGGFEKVGQLGTNLPRNDEQILVSAGDVVLYQGNSVTIYYDSNSWDFTLLGKVKGLSESEIRDILSADSITVTFSNEK